MSFIVIEMGMLPSHLFLILLPLRKQNPKNTLFQSIRNVIITGISSFKFAEFEIVFHSHKYLVAIRLLSDCPIRHSLSQT